MADITANKKIKRIVYLLYVCVVRDGSVTD